MQGLPLMVESSLAIVRVAGSGRNCAVHLQVYVDVLSVSHGRESHGDVSLFGFVRVLSLTRLVRT